MDKFLNKVFINTPNKEVIFNSSKTMRYETNPKFLFSYEEKIAEISDDGEIYIYDKTARGGNYFSQTTSKQIYKVINFLKKNNLIHELISDYL